MGGKTKKKQARKQAATRTKSNGGRNGVSGHMKKSTIGNGKRAAVAAEGSLPTKKGNKNITNQKSTNSKRKRTEEDDGDEDETDEEAHRTADESSDVRGSSMFTSLDDNVDGKSDSKDLAGIEKATVSTKDSKRKKQRLSDVSVSSIKTPVLSIYKELVPTKLITLEDTSFSRLLYPNPVCFLTTINHKNADGSVGGLNAMTLSWMTPVNNYGGFAFAIHKTRFSAANLLASGKFTLSVPTAQSRDLVLAVGRVSGMVVKKFDGSIPNLKAGAFGCLGLTGAVVSSRRESKNGFDALLDSDDENDQEVVADPTILTVSNTDVVASTSSRVHHAFPPPIDGTVAHMNCTVLSHTDAADAGTYLVIAKINRAAVHAEYWSHKGKCFVTAGGEKDIGSPGVSLLGEDSSSTQIEETLRLKSSSNCLPPILSFLGSQRFGHIVSE